MAVILITRRRDVCRMRGIENLFRVDVEVLDEDGDTVIRKVTGFIGEPVIPGQSNRSWSRGSSNSGETS